MAELPRDDQELLKFQRLICQPARGRSIEASGAVPPGGVLVVRGPSGAGKSTLLRALARLIPAVSGQVWLQGRPMASFPATLWRQKVHYLPQRPVVFDGTVMDNLLVPFRLRAHRHRPAPSRPSLMAALQRLGLAHTDQDARTLSGGELARVALLRAVLANPTVLLLDEPTAALDSQTRRLTLEFLRDWLRGEPVPGPPTEHGRGIVLVSHLEEDLQFFQTVAVIHLQRSDPQATGSQDGALGAESAASGQAGRGGEPD